MTVRSARSNERAVSRAVRDLRRADRLGPVEELLMTLLATSARLVDAGTGPESDMAGYARARVLQVHGNLVAQLHTMVGPISGEDSAFEAFFKHVSEPTPGSTDRAFTEDRFG